MVKRESQMIEQQQISKEEFLQWKNDRVTQQVLRDLQAIQTYWKDALANGVTISKDAELSTELVIGRIQGLQDCIGIDWDEETDIEEPKVYGH